MSENDPFGMHKKDPTCTTSALNEFLKNSANRDLTFKGMYFVINHQSP